MLSDYLRNRPLVMSISTLTGFLSTLLLAIWNIPTGLKWFAFFIRPIATPYGPLAMSWANEICGADAEERAIVLGVMNASGYAVNAWLPLLTYPAKRAPRFKRGFTFSACAFVAQGAITALVAWLWKREKKRDERHHESRHERGEDVSEQTRLILS